MALGEEPAKSPAVRIGPPPFELATVAATFRDELRLLVVASNDDNNNKLVTKISSRFLA